MNNYIYACSNSIWAVSFPQFVFVLKLLEAPFFVFNFFSAKRRENPFNEFQ